MKEKFKIEKELLFKNAIKEVTSISLDSDYDINKNDIMGNFIISGEYKIHEVSINKEPFNFKIPFKHTLPNDIDLNTVKLEIYDFLYDYKKDELMIKIEYHINADRQDILIFENEETLDEFLNKREVEVIDTRVEEIKDKTKEIMEENNIIKDNLLNEVLDVNANINVIEDNFINSEEILNNMSSIDDTFVTYKIYTVLKEDNLESILFKNHVSIDDIKEYNDLSNITVGDKLIIPKDE